MATSRQKFQNKVKIKFTLNEIHFYVTAEHCHKNSKTPSVRKNVLRMQQLLLLPQNYFFIINYINQTLLATVKSRLNLCIKSREQEIKQMVIIILQLLFILGTYQWKSL